MGIKRHTEKSLSIVCTDPEISFRKKEYPNSQSVLDQKHKICCTACGRNLMKELPTGLLCIHPSLEVIICKECLQFYGDGLFKTDKKGDDVYCRWCAQGGTIYCCSKCSVAFCKKCIDRNLKNDKKVMTDINKDTWACFICASKPLWPLRAFCWAVQSYKKELIGETRKRKLSTSSAESLEKYKPGPASAKKSFAGPASKKLKIETPPQKKPGPASKTIASKKPGPASRTKIIEEPEVKTSIQTRHKKIDYSTKIEFPMPDPPKKRKSTPKRASSKNKKAPLKNSRKSKKFTPDESSDEDFDDFENEETNSESLDHETTGPIENVMDQVFDFCFKLSNNFNSKLIKYQLFYKGNMSTSEKVNNACVNLHMDLKKIVHLYKAIDEKMMFQLDEFNSAQQALEQEKLDLAESVTGDIDIESYGIDPKTPPEPEIIDENIDEEVNESEDLESTDITYDKATDKNEEGGMNESENLVSINDTELNIENEKNVDESKDTTTEKEENGDNTNDSDEKGENVTSLDKEDNFNETMDTDEKEKNLDEAKEANGEETKDTNEKAIYVDEKTCDKKENLNDTVEETMDTVEEKNVDETKDTDEKSENVNSVEKEENGDKNNVIDEKEEKVNEFENSMEIEENNESIDTEEQNKTSVEDVELSNSLSDVGDPQEDDEKTKKESEEIKEPHEKNSETNDESHVEDIGRQDNEVTGKPDENIKDESISTEAENSNAEKEQKDSSTKSQENDETGEDQNGLNDPAKESGRDIDGLSDISDKEDNFDSFDTIGTKIITQSTQKHSNGHAPASVETRD